jgi:hypothetical protein
MIFLPCAINFITAKIDNAFGESTNNSLTFGFVPIFKKNFTCPTNRKEKKRIV